MRLNSCYRYKIVCMCTFVCDNQIRQMMIQTKKNLRLETLNSRIEMIELGHMEFKDRPSPISVSVLSSPGHSLRQSGENILTLMNYMYILTCRNLPSFGFFSTTQYNYYISRHIVNVDLVNYALTIIIQLL